MMYNEENITMVRCPYDPQHVVRSFRFPRHLIKCKKNHPHIQLEPCLYNFSHLIRDDELFEHFQKCPEKKRIESNRYKSTKKMPHYCEAAAAMDEVVDALVDDMELHAISDCNDEREESGSNDEREESGYNDEREGTATNYSHEGVNIDKVHAGISEFVRTPPIRNGAQMSTAEDKSEDEIQPLPLPKTKSKVFKINKVY